MLHLGYQFIGLVEESPRLTVKVLSDWTAVVQLRHPNEVSGLYFVVFLLVTIKIGIIAADGYEKVGVGEEEKVTKKTIAKTMVVCCVALVFLFVALLCSMNKAYIHTLLSRDCESVYPRKFHQQ